MIIGTAIHLTGPAHHHGPAPDGVAQQATFMAVATQLAVVEVLAATVVLYFRTRGRPRGLR